MQSRTTGEFEQLLNASPLLKLGIFGTSLKPNEKRVPIHPDHIELIPKEVRTHLVFEQGYGLRFGVDDASVLLHHLS